MCSFVHSLKSSLCLIMFLLIFIVVYVLWLWLWVYNIHTIWWPKASSCPHGMILDLDDQGSSRYQHIKKIRNEKLKWIWKKKEKARTKQNKRDTKRKKKWRDRGKEQRKMQQTGRKKKTRTDQQRKTEKMKKKKRNTPRLSKLLIRILFSLSIHIRVLCRKNLKWL